MKKAFLTFHCILLIFSGILAQSPQKFNYQAIARDASGSPIVNQSIAFRISILQGTASGSLVYQETHLKTTNAYGQSTLVIGGGAVTSGTFNSIAWGNNSYYIQTEMDAAGGSSYTLMGASQLLSVPYALYSSTAGGGYVAGSGINIAGTTISNTAPDQTVVLTGGTGIGTSGVYPNLVITNTLPNATHTGDATGGSTLTVEKIQGRAVATTTPSDGQALKWNFTTSKWEPATDNNTTYTAGAGISLTGTVFANTLPNATHTGDATGGSTLTVEKIQGRAVATTAPSDGQALKWNITTSKWEPAMDNNTTYTAGAGISLTGTVFANTSPNATHTGDATGGSTLTVEKIQGRAVATTVPSDGQVLKWNNSSLKWEPSTLSLTTSLIRDADNNTKVQVEKNSNEDKIRFDLAGVERWVMAGARLEAKNSGGTLLIGDSTGYNDGLLNSSTFLGYCAGKKNTSGIQNTALGFKSLYSNTTASRNTALGQGALYSQSFGNSGISWNSYNVAVGFQALYSNQPTLNNNGINNTAIGSQSLFSNTTGHSNTASGMWSLYSNTSGRENTATGHLALYSNTTGTSNTATGQNSMRHNITGSANSAFGYSSLYGNTTGFSNTASGYGSMSMNTEGFENTASGASSLHSNTVGQHNTANGCSSLFSNTTGSSNTASGFNSLYINETGNSNTAVGYASLHSNIGGDANTATGIEALYSNTTGSYNTAFGTCALKANTTGFRNTAVGAYSLQKNVTGRWNVAIGDSALEKVNSDKNTAIGFKALYNSTGWDNSAIGYRALYSSATNFDNTALGIDALFALTTGNGNTAVGKNAMISNINGNNNTVVGFNSNVSNGVSNSSAIGYQAIANASNKIVLGNASATTVGGYGAWTNYSDRRLKENIEYRNKLGLDFILNLKTASYNYIADENKIRRDGLIAQDVQQALQELGIEFSGLVMDDDPQKTMNLSYDSFVIPLINGMQQQQAMIQKQQQQIETLVKRIEQLENK